VAQVDHVVDARAEEIVGGGAGKHHGRTPRKQPLLETKLGETTIRRHPRKPVFMRVPGIVQGRLSQSDLAMEEALFETALYLEFVDLSCVQHIPDRVSILRLRHLLEEHQLAKQILATINAMFTDKGLMMREGRVVDATLIAAPSSTKNKGSERDPEMRQTKKATSGIPG
jgi:hypothetical protein